MPDLRQALLESLVITPVQNWLAIAPAVKHSRSDRWHVPRGVTRRTGSVKLREHCTVSVHPDPAAASHDRNACVTDGTAGHERWRDVPGHRAL